MNSVNNERMNTMMSAYYTLNTAGNMAAAMLMRRDIRSSADKGC